MKSEILTPGQLEQIEKAMSLGTATQKDGVRLVNSHRLLREQNFDLTIKVEGLRKALMKFDTALVDVFLSDDR